MPSKLIATAAITFAALTVPQTQAQPYPSKPLRLIVGFVPGGGSDFIGRLVVQKFTEPRGRNVVAENRPGAGGAIATEYVAKQPAVGYTLLITSAGPNGILPAMFAKTAYDPLKDFDPITQAVSMPFLIAVHPSLPVKTVRTWSRLRARGRGS